MTLAEKIVHSYIEVIILALFLSLASPLYAAPIKVLVIDTGVAIDHPLLQHYHRYYFTTADRTPDNIHGTAIASLVMNGILNAQGRASTPVCDKVELYVCNYKPAQDSAYMDLCLDRAIALQPFVINYSSTGTAFVPSEFAKLTALKGTKFITAAGNEGDNLVDHPHYPAMYAFLNRIHGPFSKIPSLSNVIVVGALTAQDTKWDLSNYGVPMQMEPGVSIKTANSAYFKGEDLALYMTGTSAATALYTNKIINQECLK